jgi:hypothetical protein
MDAFSVGVLSGLVASSLTAFVSQVTPPLLENLQGDRQDLIGKIQKDASLNEILSQALESVIQSAPYQDEKHAHNIRRFMESPEAETAARQLYGTFFSKGTKRKTSLNAIRNQFVASFGFYIGNSRQETKSLADQLFDVTVLACEKMLERAIDVGVLAGHEAKSSLRHKILLNEISGLKKNIQFLREGKQPPVDEILKFEEALRFQIVDRHGFITPPHFDAAKRIPIEEIGVAPQFQQLKGTGGELRKIIDFVAFLANLNRAVVVGNPGGGKSTLATRICHDVADHYTQRILGGRKLTAILVVLRDYGAAKKENKYSILQFIESLANSSYQVKPPSNAVEYMLLQGRAMLIFDGLDELVETRHRAEITSDIESFANLYPSTPILVTSREVGHEQAPLDEKKFIAYRLAPFDEPQVREYVQKWFRLEDELPRPQQQQKATAFLGESRTVADLRSNPLMLALMCTIYRGENYIPRNRPDVYEKCSMMLFERWDKSRGILSPLPFEAHISPAMKFLAHWIYSNDKLQTGVPQELLIAKATAYLRERRFEDVDDARKAARDFIDFCTGRAWVFSDAGTTKEGDRLYQFTHRTFLEYFTAAHLVRTNPTPQDLLSVLTPRIAKREWDVVAQLAFQLQNKQVEGAADHLLRSLLEQSDSATNTRSSFLSFAARSLEFLVPSPKITRSVAQACLDYVFDRYAKQHRPNDARSEGLIDLLGSVISSTKENLDAVSDCFEKGLLERINDPNTNVAVIATDIALNLRMTLNTHKSISPNRSECVDSCRTCSAKIWDRASGRIKRLAEVEPIIAIECYLRGGLSLEQLIQLHGLKGVILSLSHPALLYYSWSVLDSLILVTVLGQTSHLADDTNPLEDLSLIGKTLLKTKAPWLHERDRAPSLYEYGLLHLDTSKSKELTDPDAVFATFVAVALGIEFQASRRRDRQPFEVSPKLLQISTIKTLWPFLSQRLANPDATTQSETDAIPFSEIHWSTVRAWVNRTLNFTTYKATAAV